MSELAYSTEILELVSGVRQACEDLGRVNVFLDDLEGYLPVMTRGAYEDLVADAVDLGLVTRPSRNYVCLTAKGEEVA